jgi:hypothetical protein
LAREIGYSVVSLSQAALIFAVFLGVELALGLALQRSRRTGLLGWLVPASALAAATAFFLLGETVRHAAPAAVAIAEVVDAVAGTEEAPVEGVMEVFRPDAGPLAAGTAGGGLFELNMAGLKGQARRFLLTDLESWHWENLALPAGVRRAPFQGTLATGEALAAVAYLGPDGLKGNLTAGPFRNLGDAVLQQSLGRSYAVTLEQDGRFRCTSAGVLAPGQFLASTVLSDRQQRRQEFYRTFLKQPGTGRLGEQPALLAWADPIDPQFTLISDARQFGDALLVFPLQLQRPPAGTRVTIPGALLPCRRIILQGATMPVMQSHLTAEMDLRFQLPAEVLPFTIERARVVVKINAPSRQVTVGGLADDKPVPLQAVHSPLDPIHADITQPRLLQTDAGGGLHVSLAIGEAPKSTAANPTSQGGAQWKIDYIDLEIAGVAGK